MVSAMSGQTNPYAAQQVQGGKHTHGHHHHMKANDGQTLATTQSGGTTQGAGTPSSIVTLSSAAKAAQNSG
jgi:hypothetical protein